MGSNPLGPTESGAHGVAFDSANGNIYVAKPSSNSVSVISGSTNKVIKPIAVGSQPYGVAFDSANLLQQLMVIST